MITKKKKKKILRTFPNRFFCKEAWNDFKKSSKEINTEEKILYVKKIQKFKKSKTKNKKRKSTNQISKRMMNVYRKSIFIVFKSINPRLRIAQRKKHSKKEKEENWSSVFEHFSNNDQILQWIQLLNPWIFFFFLFEN